MTMHVGLKGALLRVLGDNRVQFKQFRERVRYE